MIRELERSDLDIITLWPKFSGELSWANFSITKSDQKDQWMRRNIRYDTLWYIIKYNDEIVGRGSLIKPENNDELILGIVLRPDYTGKGIGTSALQLLIEKIFQSTGYSKIWLESKHNNTRAIAAWKKMGFQQISEHYRKNVYGKYSRFYGFRITKEVFTDLKL